MIYRVYSDTFVLSRSSLSQKFATLITSVVTLCYLSK